MTDSSGLTRMEAALVGDAAPHVVALEARLRDAQLAADIAVLDNLIAEDLLFTGPDGQLGTKAADLAAHASGTVHFEVHEPEELRVRRVSDTVVVAALRARLVVRVQGAPVEGIFRYTRIWAEEGAGCWRVVGGHVSVVG